MGKRVSQSKFAAAVGLSPRQVRRHVADGVLEAAADHTIDLAAGKRALKAASARREAAGEAVAGDAAELRRLKQELVKVQTEWRRTTADLRKLELAVKRGELVELEIVHRDAADTSERVVSVLRTIPQRTSLALDGALSAPADRRSAVIEQLVADEVERAIAELAQSPYVNPPSSDGRKASPP